MLSNSGIFSSSYNIHSKSIREPLLWSHYGDSHKGVCLIYNIPEEYILGNSMAGVPVKYGKNSLTNFFIKWSKSKQTLTNHDFIDELVKKYLSIKDVSWKYENEYRLIKSDSGEFEFDKSFLKYVCYGLNTPLENREQVNALLIDDGYKVEKWEMVRTKSDFGIQERKI